MNQVLILHFMYHVKLVGSIKYQYQFFQLQNMNYVVKHIPKHSLKYFLYQLSPIAYNIGFQFIRVNLKFKLYTYMYV